MHVIFDTTPARKTEHGYSLMFALNAALALPRRVVEVANLKALLAEFETFKAEVEATGYPVRVGFRQHPQDNSRKFPGFKKAHDESYYTTATATATQEDLYALTKRADD